MKVIHIVGFLLCIVLVAQSFLTACPTGYTPEHECLEETIQTEMGPE